MTGKKFATPVGHYHEDAYFYNQELELIKKIRGDRKLELVQGNGGKSEKASEPKLSAESAPSSSQWTNGKKRAA